MKMDRIIAVAAAVLAFSGKPDWHRVHADAVVIDMHNDVVQRMLAGEDISRRTTQGHSDLVRWNEAGVDAQFFSVWVPPGTDPLTYRSQADAQINLLTRFAEQHPDRVGLAVTAADIGRITGSGRFALLIGIEGAHAIGSDLHAIDTLYRRGVRYLGLTWNNSNRFASSAKDETDPALRKARRGLSADGKALVKEMNRIGMMIDVSHCGDRTLNDVLECSTSPVIASHSSVWSLCHNRRNLKDDQIRRIARGGGVICINFGPWFLDPSFTAREITMRRNNRRMIDSVDHAYRGPALGREMAESAALTEQYRRIRPPLSMLVDHIAAAVRLAGIDHVGLGSDFDGISVTPLGLDDVTGYPLITRELLQRGFSEADVKKILGGNILRVMRDIEAGTQTGK